MARQRRTLTKSEQLAYIKIADRMRTAGADLPPDAFDANDSPWISVKVCLVRSSLRVMLGACTFVIRLRIVALASRVRLQTFQLSSPDWPLDAYILEDPKLSNSSREIYRLLDGAEFDRDEVLNHRVEELLRRGDPMEHWLLAESLGEVPARYTGDSVMRLNLSISNQFAQVHESRFAMPIEHIPARTQPRAVRHSSLFERKDGLPSRPKVLVDPERGEDLDAADPSTKGRRTSPTAGDTIRDEAYLEKEAEGGNPGTRTSTTSTAGRRRRPN